MTEIGEAPNFYDPILSEAQIAVPHEIPTVERPAQLVLGDYCIKIFQRDPVELNGHRRMILNFILSQPDGRAVNRELYAAGFGGGCSERIRQPVLSVNTAGLISDLGGQRTHILRKERMGKGNALMLIFRADLAIARVPDEDILSIPIGPIDESAEAVNAPRIPGLHTSKKPKDSQETRKPDTKRPTRVLRFDEVALRSTGYSADFIRKLRGR